MKYFDNDVSQISNLDVHLRSNFYASEQGEFFLSQMHTSFSVFPGINIGMQGMNYLNENQRKMKTVLKHIYLVLSLVCFVSFGNNLLASSGFSEASRPDRCCSRPEILE